MEGTWRRGLRDLRRLNQALNSLTNIEVHYAIS